MALIISADEIKKTIPGYDPLQSHLVHQQSAKLADTQYQQSLQGPGFTEVILLSGGAASGKTEFMSEYLVSQDCIILDGTLPSFEGAKIKTKKALKKGKKVRIVAVWPADLRIAFGAFLQRDRKFPDEHFYRTHSQSRKALLEIAESDLAVTIELYENRFENGKLAFYKYVFESKERMIEVIRDNQYTEEDIIRIITES
jgi:hypothetical protein